MKRLQVTKKVRSYEKGTKLRKRYEKGMKLQKRYEATKKVRNYEKGTKIRKRYEVTNMVRSYEKGTNMLRNKLRKALVMKLPSYEIVTPPIGIIYYDIVMHYGKMPRATLGSSDLRSQLRFFGE